jgi:hypothetical protein
MSPSSSTQERFEARVDKSNPTGCWMWTGGKIPMGYGQLWPKGSKGVAISAHRYSWILHRGEIPEGIYVLHHCDTPACVNPDHLFLGTARDNKLDCLKKGRARECPPPKLNVENVRAIRRSTDPVAILAKRFGVSGSAIYKVLSGETWNKEYMYDS